MRLWVCGGGAFGPAEMAAKFARKRIAPLESRDYRRVADDRPNWPVSDNAFRVATLVETGAPLICGPELDEALPDSVEDGTGCHLFRQHKSQADLT